jgi:hypothetical protein
MSHRRLIKIKAPALAGRKITAVHSRTVQTGGFTMASVEKNYPLPITHEQERASNSPRVMDPRQPLSTLNQQVDHQFDYFSPLA